MEQVVLFLIHYLFVSHRSIITLNKPSTWSSTDYLFVCCSSSKPQASPYCITPYKFQRFLVLCVLWFAMHHFQFRSRHFEFLYKLGCKLAAIITLDGCGTKWKKGPLNDEQLQQFVLMSADVGWKLLSIYLVNKDPLND